MIHACGARYPHLSWLGAWRLVGPAGERVELHKRQPTHCVIYTGRAKAKIRWICRGREERFTVNTGTVCFAPANDAEHALIGRCEPWHRFSMLLIPCGHLLAVAEREGLVTVPELRQSVSRNDPALTSCMRVLADSQRNLADPACDGQEVAGLTLLLRLLTMNGQRVPEWNADRGIFSRRMLNEIVAYIDEHLLPAPALGDIASLVAMSPGHFTKKFRLSTGLSLQRFVNQRRILKSLSTLQQPCSRIADVAKDLGFSSQSHFTRLFSGLTGMTPATYRRQFRRTVG